MMIRFLFISLLLVSCAQSKRKEPVNIDMKALIGDIRARLEAGLPQFKNCYFKKKLPFQGQKELQRTLYFHFTINHQGLVSKAEIKSDEALEEATRNCMLEHLSKITFSPVPEQGSIEVKQPFRFKLKS